MTQCIYICSAGHSGSTLLDMLLGSHSRIASLGEIINLPMDWATNNRCTCGSPVRDCDLWSSVAQGVKERFGVDMRADPYSLNLGPKYAAVGDPRVTGKAYQLKRKLMIGLHYLELKANRFGLMEKLLPTVYQGLDNNLFLFDLVAQHLDVDYVVDSSKVYPKAIGLHKRAPGRLKMLLLVRDGRAVYYSMRKRNFDRQLSLASWYTHYRRALPLIEQHVPEADRLLVRYEDLATEPRNELERICQFIGIPFEESMLNFKRKVHHNVNGNDMRFGDASEIRLDTSWTQKLSGDEAAYFNRHAGWLNERLGYR